MTTTPSLTSFLGQDLYVPYYQIKLLGQPLKAQVVNDITTVTYRDSIDKIDSFEIALSNWDDGQFTYGDVTTRSYKYSDSSLFDPGKKIELWMGYYGSNDGNLKKMLTGEITSIRPTFPSSGPPTMVVGGLNILHKLHREQQSYPYIQKTDSEMAATIADRLNIEFTPDKAAASELRHDHVMQDNQLDIVFLMDRARRIGYDMYVTEPAKGETKPRLHFLPSQNAPEPAYTLNYGQTLIEFQPNLSTAKQVNEVTVRAWDAVHKKTIEATVNRKQLNIKSENDLDDAFTGRREVMATVPVRSEDEAKQLALQQLTNNVKEMIQASGSTVGLPDLRTGSRVTLGGLGKRFSYTYFVTATTHTINDSGYLTQFECRLDSQTGG